MTAPLTLTQSLKATRLIEQGRCRPLSVVPGIAWTGIIVGDSGRRYLVTSIDPDVARECGHGPDGESPAVSSCTCRGFGLTARCSHELAAMRLRVRSTSMADVFAEAMA